MKSFLLVSFGCILTFSTSAQVLQISEVVDSTICVVIEGTFPESSPYQLPCFRDYETGLAYAKEVGKPILLDFTGWGCVGNRQMEEYVWGDSTVMSILRNEVVIISLFVDDRSKLPPSDWYVSENTGREISRVGQKWSDFQRTHFSANSQPFYVMVGHTDLKPLDGSYYYSRDTEAFAAWLSNGIRAFAKDGE